MAKYQEQLERVRRYYNRFKNLNNGMELTEPVGIIHNMISSCCGNTRALLVHS